MITGRRLRTFTLPTPLLVLALAPNLAGQRPMAANLEVSAELEENAKKVKQYTYTQRTEIFLKYELKGTKLARGALRSCSRKQDLVLEVERNGVLHWVAFEME